MSLSLSLLPGLIPPSSHPVLQRSPEAQTTVPPSQVSAAFLIWQVRAPRSLPRYRHGDGTRTCTHPWGLQSTKEPAGHCPHICTGSAGSAPVSALTCLQPLSVAEGPSSARSQGLAQVSYPRKLDSGPCLWLPSAQKLHEAPFARSHLSRESTVGELGPAAGDCSGVSSECTELRGSGSAGEKALGLPLPLPAAPWP